MNMKKYYKYFLFSLTIILYSCGNDSSINRPENGELNETFSDSDQIQNEERIFTKKKDSMIADGWIDKKNVNGTLPKCYNFIPKYSDIDNSLKISVGGGTDVAVKLINLENNECIRYVFVNSGTTYEINKIPEGKYYLKIAYGKDWLSRIDKGRCVGKFIRNPNYEKGLDILDFNLIRTNDSYRIPSFHLKLDAYTTNLNTFDSSNISESEFNK